MSLLTKKQPLLYNYFKLTGGTQKFKDTQPRSESKVALKARKRQNREALKDVKHNVDDDIEPSTSKRFASPDNLEECETNNCSPQSSQGLTMANETTVTYDFAQIDSNDENDQNSYLELTITEDVNYWNVNNFEKMVKFIESRSKMRTLLTKTDRNKLELFDTLLLEYKYLLLKLFFYLPKWYNVHNFVERIKLKLNSKDINLMYKTLKEKELILTDYEDEEPIGLLNCLLAPELKIIAKEMKLPNRYKKKKELINYMLTYGCQQTTLIPTSSMYDELRRIAIKHLGQCVKLDPLLYKAFYKIYVLYTIGTNLDRPSDTAFFISRINMGQITLPSYTIQDVDLFANDVVFEKYTEAHEVYAKFLSAQEKKDKKLMEKIAKRSYNKLLELNKEKAVCKRLHPEYFYIKILCMASELLTKTSDKLIIVDWLELLLRLDCHKKHGFCYKQLSLMCARYVKSNNRAAMCLLEGLKNPNLSPIDLSALKDRANALLKRRNHNVHETIKTEIEAIKIFLPKAHDFKTRNITCGTISNESTGNKKMYVVDATIYSNVEQLALNHYESLGFNNGIHCEGSLLITLFAVLFWDIIYNDNVPNVFITELQYLPFDLYTSDFYKNREILIKERLIDIGTRWELHVLNDFVRDVWDSHSDKRSLITLSNYFKSDDIRDIIACIGREILAKILERLVSNIKLYRSGVPDLFMWNATNLTCKFVEVKADGDKLSMAQKYWLHFFNSIGVDCEVCLVKSVGSRRNCRI